MIKDINDKSRIDAIDVLRRHSWWLVLGVLTLIALVLLVSGIAVYTITKKAHENSQYIELSVAALHVVSRLDALEEIPMDRGSNILNQIMRSSAVERFVGTAGEVNIVYRIDEDDCFVGVKMKYLTDYSHGYMPCTAEWLRTFAFRRYEGTGYNYAGDPIYVVAERIRRFAKEPYIVVAEKNRVEADRSQTLLYWSELFVFITVMSIAVVSGCLWRKYYIRQQLSIYKAHAKIAVLADENERRRVELEQFVMEAALG